MFKPSSLRFLIIPLGAIMTNGEAALSWLSQAEPDLSEVRDLSERIIADAQRAADIIERIRATIVRKEPEPVRLSLNELVEDVVARSDAQRRPGRAPPEPVLAERQDGVGQVVAPRDRVEHRRHFARVFVQRRPVHAGNATCGVA